MSLEIRDVETSLPSRADRDIQPRTFSMKPEYRRSAVYVLMGIVLIPLIRWWVRNYLPLMNPSGQVFYLGVWAAFALGPIGVFRWRLRVDRAGLARRRFFRWDLWPWEAFQSGRVLDAEDDPTSFLLPEKPPWARKLSIGLLDDQAQELVAALIDGNRVRPAAPPIPNELHIRYPFRREAFIGPSGLVLLRRGEANRYSWHDVQVLRIRRRTHDRRDFSSIEVVLPDQTVTFRITHQHGQTCRAWSGPPGEPSPSPDVLAEALRRHVPEDRVLVSALSGPPRSIAEWQDRRTLLGRQGRDLVAMRRTLWGLGAFLAVVALALFREKGSAAVGMLAMCAIQWGLVWAVVRYIERSHQESIAELDAQVPDEWRHQL